MKRLMLALAACAFSTFMLVGCTGTTTNENTSSSTPGATKSPEMKTGDTKPAETKPADTTAANTGDKIGVPECDEFVTKYEACLNKVPEAGQAAYKTSIDGMRKSYKMAAATPQGKSMLAAQCKTAQESSKKAMESFHCEW